MYSVADGTVKRLKSRTLKTNDVFNPIDCCCARFCERSGIVKSHDPVERENAENCTRLIVDHIVLCADERRDGDCQKLFFSLLILREA